MEGKRLIEKIRLRNILSFGDKGEEIELLPLNVIIGQNASGKSNLIDVMKLFNSLPQKRGLGNFISKTGGIREWVWKGNIENFPPSSSVDVEFNTPHLVYSLHFNESNQRLYILFEEIESLEDRKSFERHFDSFPEETFLVSDYDHENGNKEKVIIKSYFSVFRFFTDIDTNRSSRLREPQLPDAPNDFLEESGINLALVLNDLEHKGNTKDKIVENLKKFNPQIKDYSVKIQGGTVQLFIREEGLEKPISAMRLSDGTLRYLCLLAILCHPEPPPLICIEEPEVGLHPDILPTIAELMKEASQRTQLIVTTHSDILVSAFSDMPEAVLVCEKDEDGTHFKRLEAEKLKVWLEEYTLGEAWLRGAIGGTRW
ncbi:MAG: AAA family ATPase [Pyrinomonadaceae bacterium]|nr:AAA family ATPase [Pyrinomonadaceae bacterium]